MSSSLIILGSARSRSVVLALPFANNLHRRLYFQFLSLFGAFRLSLCKNSSTTSLRNGFTDAGPESRRALCYIRFFLHRWPRRSVSKFPAFPLTTFCPLIG